MAKNLLPSSKYSAGAQKAARAMQSRYGADWKKVFYGRANKFSNAKGGMHVRADALYTKGSRAKIIKMPMGSLRIR